LPGTGFADGLAVGIFTCADAESRETATPEIARGIRSLLTLGARSCAAAPAKKETISAS